MDELLLRRMEDLSRLCLRRNLPTAGSFLTPAEQAELTRLSFSPDSELLLFGGDAEAERKIPVFYPSYLPEDEVLPERFLSAVRISTRREAFTHRDVLGSVLALGLTRESVGDIRIFEDFACVVCLPPAAKTVLASLEKVSRFHVTCEELPLDVLPKTELKTKSSTFTVQTLRLDAVTAGLFSVSRTAAADAIRLGTVALNDLPCLKPDAHVAEGDRISFRGHGKGTLAEIRGTSRKGRLFIRTERYL